MEKVTVVGTTAWGTTLAVVLAKKYPRIYLLARSDAEADVLNSEREYAKRLPGIMFPPSLIVTAALDEALEASQLVIIAVPSQTMRRNIRIIREFVPKSAVIMSASKGIEMDTGLRMSSVIHEDSGIADPSRVCVLAGPNLSREIAIGQPSATVVACSSIETADQVRNTVMTNNFRAYSSSDVIGVELAGALKNIIALGAGISDGWGYGHNAKAAFLTRGLAEITRLGVAAGASPLTFLGLAGLGDLVATSSSPLSRNRRVGEELAKGRPLAEILTEMGSVAEGIPTTRATRQLANDLGVSMPITEGMYKILFEGYDIRIAARQLMEREPKSELEGLYAKDGIKR